MNYCREKTSAFFTWFANGLSWKRPAIIPLSKSPGSPAHQTSLIFKLPDELILSILYYISPDPHLVSYHARFHVQYSSEINDYHKQRVQFLLPLSMTCKAMWLQLVPWIWGRLTVAQHDWNSEWTFNVRKLRVPVNVFLAASVKFMSVDLPWYGTSFVKCLESLPNLHTLEIKWTNQCIAPPLNNALENVKLPQIKNLILPPVAHPLLRHCCNVEDVACVVRYETVPPEGFLGSLASNPDSKIERLAIPLVLWADPSIFVAACPRLTELTITCPHPYDGPVTETGIMFDPVESVHSAVLSLVTTCKMLPDFDTLQIVHFSYRGRQEVNGYRGYSEEQPKRSTDELERLKDWAISCLKSETGSQEGEGKKRKKLRVIKLSPDRPLLGSVKVEVYEV